MKRSHVDRFGKGACMADPNLPVRSDPESLAPIQLERSSVDEDIAQMKRGKGLRLTLTLAVGLAAITGGTQLLRSMDAHQAYAKAGEQLELVDAQQSEAFLRCALPNLQRSQLDDPSELHTAIEIATERMDKAYGRVLAQCDPLLESFQEAVNQIKGPADMTRRLSDLSNAAGQLGGSWQDYRKYLQDPAQHYDYVQAAPRIEKITNAWANYQKQRNETRDALAQKR